MIPDFDVAPFAHLSIVTSKTPHALRAPYVITVHQVQLNATPNGVPGPCIKQPRLFDESPRGKGRKT